MSKSKFKNAQYSVNECIKKIQNYSHASKADMKYMLNRCVKDLHELGYMFTHIKGLKSKHIHILVEHWKTQNKNPATIKNYMAKLRKVASVLNKATTATKSINVIMHLNIIKQSTTSIFPSAQTQ